MKIDLHEALRKLCARLGANKFSPWEIKNMKPFKFHSFRVTAINDVGSKNKADVTVT
jgi:hypothetical protein